MGHGSLPSSCLEAPTHALWLQHAYPRYQQQEQNGTTPQREPSSALALLRRAASRQASSRALRPCRWIASRSAAAVLFRRWESFRRASSLRRSRAADCSFASAVLSLRVCAHCCFCAAYAVSELFGGGASFRLPPLPIAGQRGASNNSSRRGQSAGLESQRGFLFSQEMSEHFNAAAHQLMPATRVLVGSSK